MRYKNLLAAMLICAVLFTSCSESVGGLTGSSSENAESSGAGSSSSGSQTSTGSTTVSAKAEGSYAEEDMDARYQEAESVLITLNGDAAQVSGDGAEASGSTVTITEAGTYLLRGTLNDGQILIDADKEALVRLVLDGVALSSSSSAPIYAKQCEKLVIILAPSSENTVTDGEAYTYAEGEDEPNAAIFSKDDLTITGTGSLSVTGNANNGVGTKDDLVITGGTISINAENNGLKGKDSISIADGSLTIHAGGDGIQSDNETEPTKGYIILDGGVFFITAGNDGVQAETALTVNGGSYTLLTGGGAENGETHNSNTPMGRGGQGGVGSLTKEDVNAASSQALSATALDEAAASDSYKGLKAGTNFIVNGGSFSIDSADDGVHANGDVTIAGGELTISTGDDGVHADGSLLIKDGTIQIDRSYEGLEGSVIDLDGGSIRLTSSDDGLNAAGGSDGGTGFFGADSFGLTEGVYIRISGGSLWIKASGDGIDSNGDLFIEGGTICVNGPTSGGNGSLDYNGSCAISGGVLLTAESTGMLQAPGEASSQNTLVYYFISAKEAGTRVTLQAEDGTVLESFVPDVEYQAVIFSTPSLKDGESYTVLTGGELSGAAQQGFDEITEGGTLTGGASGGAVTLSGTVTKVSEDGSAVTGGMGDGFGRGGQGGFGGADGSGRQKPSGTPPASLPAGESAPAGVTA